MSATRLVIPEVETEEGYEAPLDPENDGIGAAGFYPQYSQSPDTAVGVERDVDGNLVFKDTHSGTMTLTQIASGNFEQFISNTAILDENGNFVYVGNGELVVK